jgi:hypothetical protein
MSIQRASHVEPDEQGQWWADLAPVHGPKLGPFAVRSAALDAERCWLEAFLSEPSSSRTNFEELVGLTIHYGLTTDLVDVESIRSSVQRMRHLAMRLPFQEVGDVVEFTGHNCNRGCDDPHRWLAIQAGQYVQDGDYYIKVPPLHIVAFTIQPGTGSEPANFGFARFPESIDVRELNKHIQTRLTGWSWKAFCKTQYASSSAAGGVANFVRCHGSIVTLLDAVHSRNLARVSVHDESDYWTHRDVRKLAETVGEWNEMVAAVAGQIKDLANGATLEAPIMQFPDVEHLEARGRTKLDTPPSSSVGT